MILPYQCVSMRTPVKNEIIFSLSSSTPWHINKHRIPNWKHISPSTKKWTNEWTNQPTNKQTNERTNEWTNQQTNTDCDCFDADKASGSSSISSASWPPANSTDLWLYAKAGRMRRWLSTASERSTNPQVFDCYLPIQRFPISALSS